MKIKYLLISFVWACTAIVVLGASSSLGTKEARRAIANIPGLEFDPKLVSIKSIEPPNANGGSAIVEAQFLTAFRLQKRQDWQVAEIRLGNGNWEDAELIITAIRNEKIKRTRERLTSLASAIAAYQREQGYYPRARDIVDLTDQLAPKYINAVLRDDLWATSFQYSSDGKSYRLQSWGPDKKPTTGDEITLQNGQLIDKP